MRRRHLTHTIQAIKGVNEIKPSSFPGQTQSLIKVNSKQCTDWAKNYPFHYSLLKIFPLLIYRIPPSQRLPLPLPLRLPVLLQFLYMVTSSTSPSPARPSASHWSSSLAPLVGPLPGAKPCRVSPPSERSRRVWRNRRPWYSACTSEWSSV